MIDIQAKANFIYCTVIYPLPHPPTSLLLYRGFEPGAVSLEVYKMVKIAMKKVKFFSAFEPASFRVNVHNATSELPDSVKI